MYDFSPNSQQEMLIMTIIMRFGKQWLSAVLRGQEEENALENALYNAATLWFVLLPVHIPYQNSHSINSGISQHATENGMRTRLRAELFVRHVGGDRNRDDSESARFVHSQPCALWV